MGGRNRARIRTDGGDELAQENPFAGLDVGGLPETSQSSSSPPVDEKRGKGKGPATVLLLRRLKAGRGGKVVTEISGFEASRDSPADLLKVLQSRLGTGGTLRGDVIELQGERRTEVKPLLEAEGYRVKGAGR